MVIEAGMILQILGGLGSLVGIYVVLTNRITKLEAIVEHNKVNIEKIGTDRKELQEDIKEMKEVMNKMLITLTKLETLQEVKNDGKNK